MENALLDIAQLRIAFGRDGQRNEVIHGISYRVYPNEIVGIVGESGSGKSVSTLAVMGLLPPKTSHLTAEKFSWLDRDLQSISPKDWRQIRGKEIAMIFQEPMSSLNPSMRCGEQVSEMLLQHEKISKAAAKAKVIQLFEQVKLPNPELTYAKYPHEISGGQKQRVMIAMAISCNPKLLIADEPTTALDVTVQKEIILLLKELQRESGMSILFITHDLALIAEIADRVMVMYKGDIVDMGTTAEVFQNPQSEYTQALLGSRPTLTERPKRLLTIDDVLNKRNPSVIITAAMRQQQLQTLLAQPPLLEVKNVSKTYFTRSGWLGKPQAFQAVDNVTFQVYEGETLGLVGESGCGKSTLGNAILNLQPASSGSILYRDQDITQLSHSEFKRLRKEIQIIFQDPYASLNPRLTVGEAILEPMRVHGLYANDTERKARVIALLERVGLQAMHYDRFPHEFSGGQRQRIGIARTIALQPKLIVCDESVSALDISVQAQVLNLLNELKEDFGFTYIFISHDLAVVKYMSDHVVVMNKGKIEEMNEADALYAAPQKPYTQKLIDAIPKGL